MLICVQFSQKCQLLQFAATEENKGGFKSQAFFFRYLLVVLMEAERAWSYAMQLKQEANTEPRKRFHLLARLRKAAKHSEKLEKLCESPRVDAKTKLEAQVPLHYIKTVFIIKDIIF